MNTQIGGRCFQVGNGITAYQIVSRERWVNAADDAASLGDYLFEKLAPDAEGNAGAFRAMGYNIVVAGGNFGCGGKSNDNPVLALKGAGVDLVIAESFNRIFFRNAINLGLPVALCPGLVGFCSIGDEIECELRLGLVKNLSSGKSLSTTPLSPLALEILSAGSLLDYYKAMSNTPELLFKSKGGS